MVVVVFGVFCVSEWGSMEERDVQESVELR